MHSNVRCVRKGVHLNEISSAKLTVSKLKSKINVNGLVKMAHMSPFRKPLHNIGKGHFILLFIDCCRITQVQEDGAAAVHIADAQLHASICDCLLYTSDAADE